MILMDLGQESDREGEVVAATSHSNPECVCVVRGAEALSDTLGVRMHKKI